MKARVGRHKVDRIEALSKVIRDIVWKAQLRLCGRYRRLRARGKIANVVNVAIARDGGLRLVDRLYDPIRAEDGLNEHLVTKHTSPRRGMRRRGRDNAGDTSPGP